MDSSANKGTDYEIKCKKAMNRQNEPHITKANDPAFSKPAYVGGEGAIDPPQVGLTKREYFAAMAMQGLLANRGAGDCDGVCHVAVYHADELIRQLNPRHS